MPKKKKEKMKFFWEGPVEKAKGELDEAFEKFKFEPFEFKFTIPNIRAIPEMRLAKTIPINISTTEKEVIVQAELPGFKKDEINLSVTESAINISANKKEEKIERTENLFRQEISAGSIKRSFSLPSNVDPDSAKAKLENGLLIVTLEKMYPEKKKRKKVEIS